MIVHDLSDRVIEGLVRVDLAAAQEEPDSPFGTFDFHGCTWGVASFVGTPPWELHTAGDELLHILDGQSELTLLEDGQAHNRTLGAGTLAVVPRGCWHRNHAPQGVTMIYLTPTEGNNHSWDDPRNT